MKKLVTVQYPADLDLDVPAEFQRRPASALEIRDRSRETRKHKPEVFYELSDKKSDRSKILVGLTSSSENLGLVDKKELLSQFSKSVAELPRTPLSTRIAEKDFVFSPKSTSTGTPTTSITLEFLRTVGTTVASSILPVPEVTTAITSTSLKERKVEVSGHVTVSTISIINTVTTSSPIQSSTSKQANIVPFLSLPLPVSTVVAVTGVTAGTTVTSVINTVVTTPVVTTSLSVIAPPVTQVTASNIVLPTNTVAITATSTTTVTTSVQQVITTAVVTSSSSSVTMSQVPPEPINISPMPYRGAPGESALDWLSGFTKYCTFKGVNEDRKKALFCLMMLGPANDWVDSLNAEQTASYAQLEAAFKDRYGTPECMKFKGVSNIFARRQGYNENVNDYIAAVQKLAKENGLQDEMTLYAILNGLKPELAPWINSKSPKTIKEVIEYGRVAEATLTTTPAAESSILQSLESIQQQVEQLGAKVDRQHVRSVSRSPTPTRSRRVTFDDSAGTRATARDDSVPRYDGRSRPFNRGRQRFGRVPQQYAGDGRQFQPGNDRRSSGSGTSNSDRCPKCNETRHVDIRFCRALNATCFRCSKVGHHAICCWRRDNQNMWNGARRGGHNSRPYRGRRSD